MKEKYDNTQFLRHLPSELRTFLEHVQGLDYYSRPDYSLLTSLLQRCMDRKGVRDNDAYDWERPLSTDNHSLTTATTTTTNVALKETKVPG